MHFKVDAACVHWIDSDEALQQAATAWGRLIGLDTEFQRTDTFYPIAGLYQVIDAGQVYLIDPLAITHFQPLVDVLEDPAVVKIMHACQEDLELFHHHLHAEPRGIVDLQLANAFVSEVYSIGYAGLVEQLLGVALDKKQTRSDWLQRPLQAKQLAYAAADVWFLPSLYEELMAELRAHDRLAWFRDDMRERGRYTVPDIDSYYLGVNQAWRLNGSELGALKALCAWRERQARTDDRPRNRVVRDEQLLEMARRPALSEAAVAEIVPGRGAARHGAALLAAWQAGRQAEIPPAPPVPLTQSQAKRLKEMRAVAVAKAEALGMASELLARKKDLEVLLRNWLLGSSFASSASGWRGELLADAWDAQLGAAN